MRVVGDIMFDRGIERQWRGEHGLASLFGPTRAFLRAPDLTFGNLETTLSTGGARQSRIIHIRSHPNAAFALADAGFDVVTLANNHAEDFGATALADTMRVLDDHGIAPVGAARPGHQWPGRTVLRRGGVDVAFLGFTVFRTASTHWVHDDPRGLSIVQAQVRAARHAADLVVVAFHWGVEYQAEITERQYALGRAAIDAGADLVVGHHSHRLSGVGVYQGRAIAYSLGNFVFDQPWKHTRSTMALDWRVTAGGDQTLRLYPVQITNRPFAPRVLLGDRARAELEGIRGLCAGLGTESRIVDGTLEILGLGVASD